MASGGLSRQPTHRGGDDGLRRLCRPPAPPVALCVAWGDGVAGAPRRRDRAPWAGGGPDGGRGGRPETDAHRGIIGR